MRGRGGDPRIEIPGECSERASGLDDLLNVDLVSEVVVVTVLEAAALLGFRHVVECGPIRRPALKGVDVRAAPAFPAQFAGAVRCLVGPRFDRVERHALNQAR